MATNNGREIALFSIRFLSSRVIAYTRLIFPGISLITMCVASIPADKSNCRNFSAGRAFRSKCKTAYRRSNFSRPSHPPSIYSLFRFPHVNPRLHAKWGEERGGRSKLLFGETHLETRIALTVNSIYHFRQIAIRPETAVPGEALLQSPPGSLCRRYKGGPDARGIRKLGLLFPVNLYIAKLQYSR